MKFLIKAISLLIVLHTTSFSYATDDENVSKKNAIVGSATALGGWIGYGLGNTATKKLAELIYAKEAGSLLRTSTEIAQISDFVEIWGGKGKAIGSAAGMSVCAYFSNKAYKNRSSYIASWQKLWNAMKNQDLSDIGWEDLTIYVGNSAVVGVIGWSLYDLSK